MPADPLIPALRAFTGMEHIIPAGRGALGIYAALRAWGGSGPVALPAAVCQDVIAAILLAGRQPFFCDVDPATGLTPAAEWRRARAAGAEVAIVVHLYGNPADTAAVRAAFADGMVIDDAAQALGACTSDGLAGTGGDVGLISFGHTKHIEVGGAALLCRDPVLARSCTRELAGVIPASETEAQAAEAAFRAGFRAAREHLIRTGEARGFAGLLDGYSPALRVAWHSAWSGPIVAALANYPTRLSSRRAKAARWAGAIAGTGLVPVGMGEGSAPWRYACRLPGGDWTRQHRLGESLRGHGLHVSHWYLPGHWFLGAPSGSLPGVEQLAREVFQFWLDELTGMEVMERAGPVLLHCLQPPEQGQ